MSARFGINLLLRVNRCWNMCIEVQARSFLTMLIFHERLFDCEILIWFLSAITIWFSLGESFDNIPLCNMGLCGVANPQLPLLIVCLFMSINIWWKRNTSCSDDYYYTTVTQFWFRLELCYYQKSLYFSNFSCSFLYIGPSERGELLIIIHHYQHTSLTYFCNITFKK